MQITIIVDDSQTWPLLHRIAEQRGCGVPALVMSFVGRELGQICLPCAGMGFGHDGADACKICGGDGLNPFVSRRGIKICSGPGCTFGPEGVVHGEKCDRR